MKAMICPRYGSPDVLYFGETEKPGGTVVIVGFTDMR